MIVSFPNHRRRARLVALKHVQSKRKKGRKNVVASKQSIQAIELGFSSLDRYSQSECEKNLVAARITYEYEKRADARLFYRPPPFVRDILIRTVESLYENIDIDIHECTEEPYFNCEEMARDVRDNHRMFVRKRSLSAIIGKHAQHWRTVHDLYGHARTDAPFTMSGEFIAYVTHTDQFPRECWPFIYNNVISENVRRLNKGEFYCISHQCGSIFVFSDDKFGPEAEFHKIRL